MKKIRYVLSGGDNSQCLTCGGIGDRFLLRVDDNNKTYKVVAWDLCIGKYCWRRIELDGGGVLARGELVDGKLLEYKSKHKLWVIQTNGDELEYYRVTIKNNKYGKDGEFRDKLDTYKWEK